MAKLHTMAVSPAQNRKIRAAAEKHARKQNQPLSEYYVELHGQLRTPPNGRSLPVHHLIKTTHSLRRNVVIRTKAKPAPRIMFRGKSVPCYMMRAKAELSIPAKRRIPGVTDRRYRGKSLTKLDWRDVMDRLDREADHINAARTRWLNKHRGTTDETHLEEYGHLQQQFNYKVLERSRILTYINNHWQEQDRRIALNNPNLRRLHG